MYSHIFITAMLAATIFYSSSAKAENCDPTKLTNEESCIARECAQLGTSTMDANQKNIIVCLKNADGTRQVWKSMSSSASTKPTLVEHCSNVVKTGSTYTNWAKCPDSSVPVNMYCKVEGTGWSDVPNGGLYAGKWSMATNHSGQIGNQIDKNGTQIKCWDNGQQVGIQACAVCFE